MENKAERSWSYLLSLHNPLFLYPLSLCALLLLLLFSSAFLFQKAMRRNIPLSSILGIKRKKDFLFLFLVFICALFVLLVLLLSLGFLPSSPPLPA